MQIFIMTGKNAERSFSIKMFNVLKGVYFFSKCFYNKSHLKAAKTHKTDINMQLMFLNVSYECLEMQPM